MNDILKFIARLNPKDQMKIWNEIRKIQERKRRGKKIKGGQYLFSVRLGKIRIIYYKSGSNFWIHSIDWRNKVYKKLR